MSLAASSGVGGLGGGGGGGAASGMAMANHANMMQRAAPLGQAPPQATKASGTAAPPPSAAALGADLFEKQQQQLTLKQVKTTSHLPIVAIDLHAAASPLVALYPPKPSDPTEGILPTLVGKMKAQVRFRQGEQAHKVLRKYLSQSSPTYRTIQTEVSARADDAEAIEINDFHFYLGLRRLEDAPSFLLPKQAASRESVGGDKENHAIAPETLEGTGMVWTNGTLDGSSAPQNDDFDRIVAKIRLADTKKTLTLLPEEGVQMILRQAQYHVAAKVGTPIDSDEQAEEIESYPLAVALPAWACHDAAVEALLDVTENAVLLPRSVCAAAGAIMPLADGTTNPLLQRVLQVQQGLQQEHQRSQSTESFRDDMLLVLVGMTEYGVECTALQISNRQANCMSCPFGTFKVLSNVSYQSRDPLTLLSRATKELEETLNRIAPEADGPAAIVTYGALSEQESLTKTWYKLKSQVAEWTNVPVFATRESAICMGTAILAAVSHGRISKLVESGKKSKADLALHTRHVASVAVGVRLNYFGKDESKWTDVKTIFDFDRRVPAGPYPIELKASECVVYRTKGYDLNDEDFVKATKEVEGAKGIPRRENAALDLRIQMLQKWTRDGEWKRLGDPMEPLVKIALDDERVACESVTLEVSMGVTGMITTQLVGDRESVVQATKSARNSMLRYYLGILFCILFFGGFLVRSYWESYVFDRDTNKLLAYYKHVVPDSLNDGDNDTARYLVWKYRHKKDRLWKTLEKKYGVSVRDPNEWGDYKHGVEEEVKDEVDLDNGEPDAAHDPSNEKAATEEKDTPKDEPDL